MARGAREFKHMGSMAHGLSSIIHIFMISFARLWTCVFNYWCSIPKISDSGSNSKYSQKADSNSDFHFCDSNSILISAQNQDNPIIIIIITKLDLSVSGVCGGRAWIGKIINAQISIHDIAIHNPLLCNVKLMTQVFLIFITMHCYFIGFCWKKSNLSLENCPFWPKINSLLFDPLTDFPWYRTHMRTLFSPLWQLDSKIFFHLNVFDLIVHLWFDRRIKYAFLNACHTQKVAGHSSLSGQYPGIYTRINMHLSPGSLSWFSREFEVAYSNEKNVLIEWFNNTCIPSILFRSIYYINNSF